MERGGDDVEEKTLSPNKEMRGREGVKIVWPIFSGQFGAIQAEGSFFI